MPFTTLLRLELRKQSSVFRGALVLLLGMAAIRFLLFLFAVNGIPAAINDWIGIVPLAAASALLAAVYLGISWGGDLRSAEARDRENLFPVSTPARVLAAFFAGLLYLTPFLILIAVLELQVPAQFLLGYSVESPDPNWLYGALGMLVVLLKIYLLSFLAGCWIQSGPVGAFAAIIVSLIDAACTWTLWKIQNYFAQLPDVYDASQYLVGSRLLLDILLVVLVLYSTGLLTSQALYGGRKKLLSNAVLPVCCFAFGPLTSWLISIFLMTPPMHAVFHWPYPVTVFYEVARMLNLG